MPAPTIGSLTRRITIEQLALTKDAQGGMVNSWSSFAAVWAKVMNLPGGARHGDKTPVTSHGGVVPEARTEFTIRYRDDITAQMRVNYNGRLFNIRHINNWNEENRFQILTCDTGLNDGR